ncbi:MAG: RNA polymerase sigma factor RpoE [Burkholderiaceae bacterium]|jgi:RNA polymerase sigma-70 factor (ECF subfamily)|nr:MAG: RNA polymerase sigma factor RpoE [Burkholderiaceae bacterium]
MTDGERSRRFEEVALPHLDAAYNLARWLSGSASEADDVVQESFLRAFRFFDGFRGGNARAWLLAIVRNTWYSEWNRRPDAALVPFDDAMDDAGPLAGWNDGARSDPETLAMQRQDAEQVHRALADLPVPYREVLVLRELEDMSYGDIAAVAGIPVGTVMSRLSRGRRLLAAALRDRQQRPGIASGTATGAAQGADIGAARAGRRGSE